MPHRKKEIRGTLTDADAVRSSSMRTCFDSSSSQNSMQIRGNLTLELHITFI